MYDISIHVENYMIEAWDSTGLGFLHLHSIKWPHQSWLECNDDIRIRPYHAIRVALVPVSPYIDMYRRSLNHHHHYPP